MLARNRTLARAWVACFSGTGPETVNGRNGQRRLTAGAYFCRECGASVTVFVDPTFVGCWRLNRHRKPHPVAMTPKRTVAPIKVNR